MKKLKVLIGLLWFSLSASIAQELPDSYLATHKLVAEIENKAEVFTDSLHLEKCQIYKNENILSAMNRVQKTIIYFNENDFVAVETSGVPGGKQIQLYDYSKGVKIRLVNEQNKIAQVEPLQVRPPTPEVLPWTLTGSTEKINDYTTKTAEGSKDSRFSNDSGQVWVASKDLFPKHLLAQLPVSDKLDGVMVKQAVYSKRTCLKRNTYYKLSAITEASKTFDLSDWTIEKSSVQPNSEEEEMEEAVEADDY